MAIFLESFAIFMGLGLLFLVLVLFFGARFFRSGGAEAERERTEEAQLVQQLYQAMGRLENRIVSLETILAGKQPEAKEKHYESE